DLHYHRCSCAWGRRFGKAVPARTGRRAAVDRGHYLFRCRARLMEVTAGLSGNANSVDAARLPDESGAAPPKPAVTSCDELQAVFVTRPACVFRQLEILLGR